MKSLVSRASHAFNRADNHGRGKMFKYRYHSTQITTARQARNSLAYVLHFLRNESAATGAARARKRAGRAATAAGAPSHS